MIKRLLAILCVVFAWAGTATAQCPQIYDYLGNLSSTPIFKSCNGAPYTVNIQSPTSWGAYTINWGDGSPNTTGAANAANNVIPHTYTPINGTLSLVISIPGVGCTLTSTVIMEQAAVATISLATIGAFQCAPKTFTFMNLTGNQSASTTYTWTWGDGSPAQIFNAVNNPSIITHTFQKNTVQNCQTTVFLYAKNNCNFVPSFQQQGPLQIYDTDDAAVTPDKVSKCWPDNSFTFANTTLQNCLPQGNTAQRYEYWNLGDHWGKGYDSIVPWKPWPPTTPVTVTYPALGTYTVLLIDSNQCGTDLQVQAVNIVNPPTAAVTGPSVICQNTSATFTNGSAAGYSYMWNFGTNNTFSNLGSGNKSSVYATPGTYTVKVVAYVPGANSACTDTAFTVITVLAAPVANFSFSPATGCTSLAAVGFTDSSTGAQSWSWNFGNSNSFSGQSPPSQSYGSPAAYTVSLTVTGTTSCVHTKTASIIVRSTPVPNFPTFANCVGAVSNFTNTSTVTGTVAINSYSWNFGDGSTPTGTQNPVHTYTAAGTYTVKLVAATPFCKDSITKTISINVKPTANFVFTPTVSCPPFVSTFSNTTANGVNYLWRFGPTPTATSNLQNPSYTYVNNTQNIQNYTVALISQTGVGCSDSIKKVIAVYPTPIASFTTSSNQGCTPTIINFSTTSVGANTYTWNYGDASPTDTTGGYTSHTFTNNTLSFMTRTVQLIITNLYGCKDTAYQPIQVFPRTQFNTFSMTPGAGCTPLLVSFSSLPGVISYTWDYGDGSPLSNATSSVTHLYSNTTNSDKTFTVTLLVTNSYGCVDTTTVSPTVWAKPVANFTMTPLIGCSPLAVSFTNTSIGNAINTWDLGNGQMAYLPNATATYTNAKGGNAQTFNIKLVVTSINNCKDSITKSVKIFDHPQAIFSGKAEVCSPSFVDFTNSSIYANNYNWSLGNGVVSQQTNTSNYYVNSSVFDQILPIRLIAQSNDGCVDSLIQTLTVHPKPTFFIISNPDSGCTPLTVKFDKIVGVSTYAWRFDDGNTAITGDVTNTFINGTPDDRIFHITLIAADQYGCLDTARKEVKVYPLPSANFSAKPDSVFIPNQPVICYNNSYNAVSYFWKFGDGGTSTDFSPSHTYSQKGQYNISLVVTSKRGCKDSAYLREPITALDETLIEMPNAFTPNVGGSPGTTYDPRATNNDIFHPVIRGTKKYEFSIYSRWGELLFDTKDPAEGWDGYYKGKLCTQDVYIWKIAATFIDGKTYNKVGDVLLLR